MFYICFGNQVNNKIMYPKQTLKYNKTLNVIGGGFVHIYKPSELTNVLVKYSIDNIIASKTKTSKIEKALDSLSIMYDIDTNWGFDWEVKFNIKSI